MGFQMHYFSGGSIHRCPFPTGWLIEGLLYQTGPSIFTKRTLLVQSPFWIRFPMFRRETPPDGAEARGLFLRLLWLAFCVLDVRFWCRCEDRKLASASLTKTLEVSSRNAVFGRRNAIPAIYIYMYPTVRMARVSLCFGQIKAILQLHTVASAPLLGHRRSPVSGGSRWFVDSMFKSPWWSPLCLRLANPHCDKMRGLERP